ncbi:MAG: sodium:solute symporter [Burkholderiaceae bacterium]
MQPTLLLTVVAAYFAGLLLVTWFTSKGSNNQGFYVGNRRNPWPLVAFGMIGTSLSGVTFVSVPGAVGASQWNYLQIMLGHLIGYAIVAFVLLPLYYRLQLTSIYDYIRRRLGPHSGRTAAGFFILSRTLGATARLYIVIRILQDWILSAWGVPFWLTAAVILLMIVLYTFEGGVKTIVWTDTLQTSGMLFGLVACTVFLMDALNLQPLQAWQTLQAQGLSDVFATDPEPRNFWLKQITAGIFITVAMTGLDQEMMQKNISVRTLGGAQKNMLVMALVMLGVVVLFLFLGGLLHLFAAHHGMAAKGDALFPAVVMQHMPQAMQVIFVLALISALFPSADGALTALTSSFCLDILGTDKRGLGEAEHKRIRYTVHFGFAAVFLLLVLLFRWVDNSSMIMLILKIAGYTYGPLLGLFAFGLLTRRPVRDGAVWLVALAAPLVCAFIDALQATWFVSYRIGLEMLLLTGALTFAGLWLLSSPPKALEARDEPSANPASATTST